MADKNQQKFLNGAPPHLTQPSSLDHPPSGYPFNAAPNPSGLDHNSYANLPQKRSGLMVNGQVTNVRNATNSYPPNSTGDAPDANRVPQTLHGRYTSPSPVQSSQPPKLSHNSSAPTSYQNATAAPGHVPPPAGAQYGKAEPQRSQMYNSNPLYTQPSPTQLGNKLNAVLSGTQPALQSVPQGMFQPRPAPIPQQQNQYGPPSYESSPRQPASNATTASHTPENSSPAHHPQGPMIQQPFNPPTSQQSFLNAQQPGGVQTANPRWPGGGGVPQGYQPRNPPPTSSVPPQSAYNQLTTNRTLPPSSTAAPPVVPVPRGVSHPRMPPPQLPNSKYPSVNSLSQGVERLSVTKHGFNRMWGLENVDLMQCRNVLPPQKVNPPPIRLHQEFLDSVNCSPDIFRCTMNKIPETNSLLQKSRLPLGILIHPFRDLEHLPVINCGSACSTIVRCRACRTYINPFVYFVDNKRWKCNLCSRVNELPDSFQYNAATKTYGDPSRRPELRNSTIEFITPSDYLLRPPQPAVYLFILDVSRTGCDCGYLETLCSVLLEELDNLQGDSRTQIAFILFDSYVHFFSIAENYTQAHEMIVTDINEVFLPTPDSLLVNLHENKQLVRDLLQELPKKYAESFDTGSALGAALQAGYRLVGPTGGRITVFQSCLPNVGPGTLTSREDPNQRCAKDVRHLGPQTDFYKRLALDCSTQLIAVDLFLVSSQYSDLATVGAISQFSAGCVYHYPMFRRSDIDSKERLTRALRRYLTREIGFEVVMRVRCSRGLTIHTFHGNFFVRSTDLLSLPNVNPDAGFGMQVAIEDSLCDLQNVCFQAAVLYTSSKGERRIRVHTLCLPVSSNLSEILTSADQQAVVGLLSKMAVDRSLKSSLSDAREAFINAAIDILSSYKLVEPSGGPNSILAPVNLSLIPLYILALLKSTAFRTGQSTRLDDRVYGMLQMKNLPLRELIQLIHPDLYYVTELEDQVDPETDEKSIVLPHRLSLSSEHLDSREAFLLDTPDVIYLLVGRNIDSSFLHNIFDVSDLGQISNEMTELPRLETNESEKLRQFVEYLQSEKPWPAMVKVVTEPKIFQQFLVNDKSENALSYYELLHHIKAQMK